MTDGAVTTEVCKQYAAAYAAHYKTKDLSEALNLYRALIVAHPDTPEAGYSHSQIHNIAKSVVPQQKLLTAQINLAISYLGNKEPLDIEAASATQAAPEAAL